MLVITWDGDDLYMSIQSIMRGKINHTSPQIQITPSKRSLNDTVC